MFRICVQGEPVIPGRVYQGVTIMKEVGPVRLPERFEKEFEELVGKDEIGFRCRIETIYSKEKGKFAGIETPL